MPAIGPMTQRHFILSFFEELNPAGGYEMKSASCGGGGGGEP